MDKHECRDAGPVRLEDPWYDALAAGWGEGEDTAGGSAADLPAHAPHGSRADGTAADLPAYGTAGTAGAGTTAGIYLQVQRSAAFQEVRSRYRRFVVPAVLGFLLWYVAYVVAAVATPGLMARPVAGSVNIALLAGLAQFLTTFLLTWAYARHARLRRDRAALDLRWTVFEQAHDQQRDQARDQVGDQERDRGAGR
ncbi:DUF485 domain-containing protein [Streptomyces bambusae]|uniref:DUF485 domain-containing protein n=1 Tax=Streptomyces bambusae TaxID=1550616 RepID=A0ABS6Z6L2_9ACTN|nr:DUF485 domain-containing protein [Streptomyces bambusae]MBW5483398.1 DUF485 domain-containing protein [Streptomyces bambusae]